MALRTIRQGGSSAPPGTTGDGYFEVTYDDVTLVISRVIVTNNNNTYSYRAIARNECTDPVTEMTATQPKNSSTSYNVPPGQNYLLEEACWGYSAGFVGVL